MFVSWTTKYLTEPKCSISVLISTVCAGKIKKMEKMDWGDLQDSAVNVGKNTHNGQSGYKVRDARGMARAISLRKTGASGRQTPWQLPK
jgi:hypothetical protein